MNISVPPQQFSFNGPPDNLLFSSVLLVWPLAQSLPRLSTETQDLSPLSGGGSLKDGKKTQAHLLWYHLNLGVFLFSWNLAWHSSAAAVLTNYIMLAAVVFWSDEVFSLSFVLVSGCSCLWNLEWCCFQAPCFYPSYLLIANSCFCLCCFDWAGRALF